MMFLSYEFRIWNNFIPFNELFIVLVFTKKIVNLTRKALNFIKIF